MNPGEAERKLLRLEEEHAELEKECALYRAFFNASMAMNKRAAGSEEARMVRESVDNILALEIRKSIDPKPALAALKETVDGK